MAHPPVVEVRRSARRRRMVSARREGDTVIVFIPGWMSESEELRWVDEMVRRLERSEARRRSPARKGDEALHRRSVELSRRYLDGRRRPGQRALGAADAHPVGVLHPGGRDHPDQRAAARRPRLGGRLRAACTS